MTTHIREPTHLSMSSAYRQKPIYTTSKQVAMSREVPSGRSCEVMIVAVPLARKGGTKYFAAMALLPCVMVLMFGDIRMGQMWRRVGQ